MGHSTAPMAKISKQLVAGACQTFLCPARCQRKAHLGERGWVEDEQFYVDLREAVLLAEQSLMYTFNFNMTVVTPYRFMRRAYRCFKATIDPACNKYWLFFHTSGREDVRASRAAPTLGRPADHMPAKPVTLFSLPPTCGLQSPGPTAKHLCGPIRRHAEHSPWQQASPGLWMCSTATA